MNDGVWILGIGMVCATACYLGTLFFACVYDRRIGTIQKVTPTSKSSQNSPGNKHQ